MAVTVVVVGVDGVGVGRRRRRSGGSPRFSAYGIGPSRICGGPVARQSLDCVLR
jgi:hypothetical protein